MKSISRKRLVAAIAAIAAIAAVAFAVTVMAGGDDQEVMITDPHGGKIAKSEMDRVLAATAAVTSSTPKAELEAEGEKLFTNPKNFKTGESCASCHITGGGPVNAPLGMMVHRRDADASTGLNDFNGVRDVPALWGVAETAPYNWIGTNHTLEAQSTAAIHTHFADENPTPERVAAMTAFLKTIKAPESRQDQGRLTEKELRGEEVFVGKGGCISCHGGPQFTNNLIMDTDVPQNDQFKSVVGFTADDPGNPNIKQGFNTPQLRDLRNTAPYMHNGVFKTLREVIDFYNLNVITGGPLGLTEEQKDDLEAYLRAL
jgi:cytochrome c peroxidase